MPKIGITVGILLYKGDLGCGEMGGGINLDKLRPVQNTALHIYMHLNLCKRKDLFANSFIYSEIKN